MFSLHFLEIPIKNWRSASREIFFILIIILDFVEKPMCVDVKTLAKRQSFMHSKWSREPGLNR